MSNEVKFKLTATESVTKKLNGVSRAFDKLGGKGSGASLFGNVAAKGVALGFDLVGRAASGAIGFLEDSVAAARESEVSQALLASSLKANVPAWDGTTDAINRQLTAQQKLGFSDEEQANVLSKIVATTHDVSKGFDVLSLAMDVARFKHVDLATAADIVIKAMNGNKRALKELGIQLPKTATQAEILDAILRVVAGSADAYSQTLDGKVSAAQLRLNDGMEKLGQQAIPALVFAVDGLTNILDILSGSPTAKTTGALHEIERVANQAFIGFKVLGAAIQNVLFQLNRLAKSAPSFNIPLPFANPIPGFASGGTVPGPRGRPMAAIVHGGEQVIPNGGSRGGVTIQGVTEREIMDMVERGLYFKLRRAGTAT